MLIHVGERSAAREQLEEALALAHASALAGHLLYVVQAPLLRVPEDPAGALALVDRAEALLVEKTAGLWNGGPWAPAAAEARGAVLAADGDTEAATDALRQAIAGYATAGQRINEDRARRSLNEHLASTRPAN